MPVIFTSCSPPFNPLTLAQHCDYWESNIVEKNQFFYQNDHLSCQLNQQVSTSFFRDLSTPLAEWRQDKQQAAVTLLGSDSKESVVRVDQEPHTSSRPISYTAYGHDSNEGDVRLRFNGQLRDSLSGCYLLGNGYRIFNPILMRFHSPDSFSPFDAGGVNTYAYCSGDPINFSDPSGHMPAPSPPPNRRSPSPRTVLNSMMLNEGWDPPIFQQRRDSMNSTEVLDQMMNHPDWLSKSTSAHPARVEGQTQVPAATFSGAIVSQHGSRKRLNRRVDQEWKKLRNSKRFKGASDNDLNAAILYHIAERPNKKPHHNIYTNQQVADYMTARMFQTKQADSLSGLSPQHRNSLHNQANRIRKEWLK